MSKIPEPITGLVVSYSYLWRREYNLGREEGVKDRPCAIILTKKQEGDDTIVTVAPITHSEPENMDMAVEIPLSVKRHLNLDNERSWVVCNEVNRFLWVGPDIKPIQNRKDKIYSYGMIPPKLHTKIKNTIIKSCAKIVSRTS